MDFGFLDADYKLIKELLSNFFNSFIESLR